MNSIQLYYYLYLQRHVQRFRPWLAKFYPKWLITDALIHAGTRKTRDHEIVASVSFMTIYERWFKEGRTTPENLDEQPSQTEPLNSVPLAEIIDGVADAPEVAERAAKALGLPDPEQAWWRFEENNIRVFYWNQNTE